MTCCSLNFYMSWFSEDAIHIFALPLISSQLPNYDSIAPDVLPNEITGGCKGRQWGEHTAERKSHVLGKYRFCRRNDWASDPNARKFPAQRLESDRDHAKTILIVARNQSLYGRRWPSSVDVFQCLSAQQCMWRTQSRHEY